MKRRALLTAAGLAAFARPAIAEDSVPTWYLRAGATAYRIALHGAVLRCDSYAANGPPPPIEGGYTHPPLLVTRAQRAGVQWQVAGADQPDGLGLRLLLISADTGLSAEVSYIIDPASHVLRRDTMLLHDGSGPPADIRASIAGSFGVREKIERAIYLSGVWGQEAGVVRELAMVAPLRLESRDGKTGFGPQPYMLLRTAAASYVCQIFWSGNWALQVAPRPGGAVVQGGFNSWRFRHRLMPNQQLALPSVLFARVLGDRNRATQRLHDYRRAIRPDPTREIPVQFNSWYRFFGEPTAANMLPLVPIAQRLGCEIFVIDAGWHRTNDADTDDDWSARTGDWRTSRQRFPNGLREVSDACHASGLQFGLWFEPEVLGQLSAIRNEHPEWLHQSDGAPPAAKDRAILNLGVPGAWQHAYDRITAIVEGAAVDWVKWDFNTDLGAGGWAAGLDEALVVQDPVVAHYQALYQLQDAIRERFPALLIEMCASGGSRMDGAILSHAHVNWMSDQPNPLRKLAIHFGSQLAHPAAQCNDWLVEWPPGVLVGYDEDAAEIADLGDLQFRLHVAMLGSFGVSAHVDKWAPADFAVVAAHVALYKNLLRPIIAFGDQYQLTHAPPPDASGDWAAIWYAAKDGRTGALFAFRLDGASSRRRFPLAGLRPGASYRIIFANGTEANHDEARLRAGLDIEIGGKFRSELILFEAI